MKRMALLIALLMVTVVIATAQETPTFQVFGGYSYMNVGSSPHQKGFGLNGWNAQASWNLTNWLAATADFGGYYGSPSAVSIHNYTYMFGADPELPDAAPGSLRSRTVWRRPRYRQSWRPDVDPERLRHGSGGRA
jgi:hypothetical protein